MQLLKAHCVPIIVYAIESAGPSEKQLSKLDKVLSNATRRIFNVKDEQTVLDIRRGVGISNLTILYHMRACKFLLKLMKKTFGFVDILV